jgi:hypothetical protein
VPSVTERVARGGGASLATLLEEFAGAIVVGLDASAIPNELARAVARACAAQVASAGVERSCPGRVLLALLLHCGLVAVIRGAAACCRDLGRAGRLGRSVWLGDCRRRNRLRSGRHLQRRSRWGTVMGGRLLACDCVQSEGQQGSVNTRHERAVSRASWGGKGIVAPCLTPWRGVSGETLASWQLPGREYVFLDSIGGQS